MSKIDSSAKLGTWLAKQESEFSGTLAVRISLRVLPFIAVEALGSRELRKGAREMMLTVFRSILLCRLHTQNKTNYSRTELLHDVSAKLAPHRSSSERARRLVNVVYHALYASTFFDNKLAAQSAVESVDAALASNLDIGMLEVVASDCEFKSGENAVHALHSTALWSRSQPNSFDEAYRRASEIWLDDPACWSEWKKWYDLRVQGHENEWGIESDVDQELANRLESVEDTFWQSDERDPAYPNRQLEEWLADLRPKEINVDLPNQQSGATHYARDEQGRISRAPSSSQDHLKDVPAQRRKYDDIRETTSEILDDHGQQRLGRRLNRDLERLGNALPEQFEEAEAYPVWLAIRKLNARLEKHDIAARSFDPDPNRLDELCVVDLRELLDLASNFAFDDDGLRANDERTIPPQQRVSLDKEAEFGQPLVDELQDATTIITQEVSDDLKQGSEIIEEADTGSFDDQLVESAVTQRRNVFAAFLGGMRDKFFREGKKTGSEVRKGVEKEASKAGLAFLSRNWEAIKAYIGVAYRSNSSKLIEWLSTLL